ncbi:hypothetical protein [uncultured Clostridium sp.]|jgi:Zn-dependent metalloprotease|uniref:hypothetical protein n=1 Tax=uncultured Clostridium sp. TaxID=59620 RepID=UPI0026070F1A|nr:hypothetical protein [uncultured Clostridium sp.]MCI9110588.1 hypothetical protein [Bacilli bacterium]
MNKCPRCENETIKEDGRYCPICILDLERLKIVRKLEELKEDHTKLDLDVKGLEHRIEKLKRTAQEVPVQEQYVILKIDSKEVAKVVIGELKKQQKQSNVPLFV